MAEKVMIFGKDTWPYTTAAREAYKKDGRDFEYYDVITNTDYLDTMLKYSDGKRKVPTIVEQDQVIIGFDGGSWGV